MSLALYRKYRPASFAEVVGQDHVTEPLQQALRSGRVHHAYLFSGPRGCGKTSSARILARSLNCEQGPTPTPCGTCESCVALAPNGPGSLDVIEIDAASHGLVDDARDLRERAFFAPVSSRFKVYIIDEAHMISQAAFNALLKVVEEPPPHVKFIFATTEPDKVLPTIKSRTFHYRFRLIPPAVLREFLAGLCAREGIEVDPLVLPLVVRAGAGSARDALSVLDQLAAGATEEGVSYQRALSILGYTDAALLDETVDAFTAGDGAAVFRAVDRVVESGLDPRRFAQDLLERFRDLLVLDAVPDAGETGLLAGPADEIDRMLGQAARLGRAALTRACDVMAQALVDMRGTTSPRLVLELACARVLLPAASSDNAALLHRLDRLEKRLSVAGPPAETAAPAATPAPPPVAPALASEQAPAPPSATQTPAAQTPAAQAPAAQAPAAQAPAAQAPAARLRGPGSSRAGRSGAGAGRALRCGRPRRRTPAVGRRARRGQAPQQVRARDAQGVRAGRCGRRADRHAGVQERDHRAELRKRGPHRAVPRGAARGGRHRPAGAHRRHRGDPGTPGDRGGPGTPGDRGHRVGGRVPGTGASSRRDTAGRRRRQRGAGRGGSRPRGATRAARRRRRRRHAAARGRRPGDRGDRRRLTAPGAPGRTGRRIRLAAMPAQPNMQQLMKQAQQMQQQLMSAQAELADLQVEGTAGGGLVRAAMTGSGELVSLTIDPKAVDPDDVETLQDLVVAAVRDAARAASDLTQEKMGPLAGGLGLPGLPGA